MSPASGPDAADCARIYEEWHRFAKERDVERLVGVEHRIGHGDGGLGRNERVDQIAEIDDAGEAIAGLPARTVGVDEEIVVVRVVVDHPATEPGRERREIPVHPLGDAIEQRREPGVLHEREPLAYDVQPAREIPR